MAWRKWNDACPGVCYSEEPCEALLSRLGTVCGQYPRHVEASTVEDLFLSFVGPGRKGLIRLRSHRPTADLVAAVHQNLAAVVRDGPGGIRYVPWRSQRLLAVEAEWPENAFFPQPLLEPISRDRLGDLLRYELSVLLRGPLALEADMVAKLTSCVDRVSAEEQEHRRADVEQYL